jgi:hypothetical protein
LADLNSFISTVSMVAAVQSAYAPEQPIYPVAVEVLAWALRSPSSVQMVQQRPGWREEEPTPALHRKERGEHPPDLRQAARMENQESSGRLPRLP